MRHLLLVTLLFLVPVSAHAFCPFTLDRAYDFYGVIRDQQGAPVAGAAVEINVLQIGTKAGATVRGLAWADQPHKHLALRSDAQGRFQLSGCGVRLGMKLSQPGYVIRPIWDFDLFKENEDPILTGSSPATDKGTFYFNVAQVNWGDGRHALQLTPEQPFEFPAWRRGDAAQGLVAIGEEGLGETLRLKSDGRIYTIDLLAPERMRLRRRPDGAGDFRVAVRRDWQGHGVPPDGYHVSLQLTAIGGGWVETTDPFLFQAPAEGYRPELNFKWQYHAGDSYRMYKPVYLRSRDGKVHAGLHLSLEPASAPGEATLRIEATVNPDSSPNLLPARDPPLMDPASYEHSFP